MAVIELDSAVTPFDGQEFDLWGSVTINGTQFQSPRDGYFVIKGAERAYKWEIQDGLMLIGANEIFRGRTPPPFQLECSFWAKEQWASAVAMIQPFLYDPTKLSTLASIRAVTIWHPVLDLVHITQVICEGIVAPEQTSDDHMWKLTIKMREYFPPLPIQPQDKDTAPQPNGDPLSPENQNKALQVQNLTNQAKTLTWINPLS
jgi:hypothetical protein